MLSKSFMGHKLSNKQSLLCLTATSNQIRQSLTPQAPHRSRFLLITVLPYSFFKISLNILVISHHFNKAFLKKKRPYEELARIRPGETIKSFNGNPTVIV
jgi:hypothetical protein